MNGTSQQAQQQQQQRRQALPLLIRLNKVNVVILGVFLCCLLLRFSAFLVIDLGSVKTFVTKGYTEGNEFLTDILSPTTKSQEKAAPATRADTRIPIEENAVSNRAASKTTSPPLQEKEKEVIDTTYRNDKTYPSCFDVNSKEWLEGSRHGNIREGMTPELAKSMILDIPNMLVTISNDADANSHSRNNDSINFEHSVAHDLLGHSMCMKQSRFLTDQALDASDSRNVRLWAVRLVFLALHYHQHKWAIPEAQARLTAKKSDSASVTAYCSEEELKQHDVGHFDYECPDAKYLLVGLAGVGIGANVRGCTVPAFLAGLATNRVVIFANNLPAGPNKGGRWELASCDRKDHQCFFMPTTPCTLTHKDLEEAYQMSKHESRQLWNKGKLPAEHADDKVVQAVSLFQPNTRILPRILEKLTSYADELIEIATNHTTAGSVDFKSRYGPVLRAATAIIQQEDPPREGYNFAAATMKVAHSLTIYSMRPNPTSQMQLQKILQEIIPEDINSETTIGLPIRASDKCHRESECLSFEEHMQVTTSMWAKHLNYLNATAKHDDQLLSKSPSIIFTTEAKNVLEEQQRFSANETRQAVYPYRYRFVTNTKDIMPGTGKLKNAGSSHTVGDAAMLSSMSSMQAQMMARLSIGNCCSNFHALLSDFMMAGCGAASDSTFLCLQEHEDPLLRICCGWHHDCKEQKKKLLANLTKTLEEVR